MPVALVAEKKTAEAAKVVEIDAESCSRNIRRGTRDKDYIAGIESSPVHMETGETEFQRINIRLGKC